MNKSNVNLDLVTYRYVKLEITDAQANVIGENLKKVYLYIDENTKYMGSKFKYGNAYRAIRFRATKLIGRADMTVYKREVTALVNCKTSLLGRKYIRVPYKLYYIFKAIFEIVDELKVNHPLGPELECFVGKIRRDCFYNEQSKVYNDTYDDDEDMRTEMTFALLNDISSQDSVLSQNF